MAAYDPDAVTTTVDYRVLVKHDEDWVDMPGFAKDNEDEARDGARVLVPLSVEVRLVRRTVVYGVIEEDLEI